jgi:hypothetical protein
MSSRSWRSHRHPQPRLWYSLTTRAARARGRYRRCGRARPNAATSASASSKSKTCAFCSMRSRCVDFGSTTTSRCSDQRIRTWARVRASLDGLRRRADRRREDPAVAPCGDLRNGDPAAQSRRAFSRGPPRDPVQSCRLPHDGPGPRGRRRRRTRTSVVAIAARAIPPTTRRSPTLGPARQSLTGSSCVSAQAMSAPCSRP